MFQIKHINNDIEISIDKAITPNKWAYAMSLENQFIIIDIKIMNTLIIRDIIFTFFPIIMFVGFITFLSLFHQNYNILTVYNKPFQ